MTQISGIESDQGKQTRARCAEPKLPAVCTQAGRATAPRPGTWRDALPTESVAGTGTALLFAGLAPALAMAALWHTAETAPCIFISTFVIALGHAVLFGLPLFLVFRSIGWINVTTCVVLGFAVGAAPVGLLTWPQHPERHTSVPGVDVPMIISEAIRTIGWTGHVEPLIYFGSLGALGGSAFWAALMWCGSFESDSFNPSITRSARYKDGGSGAAAGADDCPAVGDDKWKQGEDPGMQTARPTLAE